MSMILRVTLRILILFGLGAASTAMAKDQFGVLVMAHGGSEEWNRSVEVTLEPLREEYPLELAFGMADPASMQDAANRLEQRGVDRIGVVRLFISGESWRERTAQILGLVPGAPPRPAQDAHAGHGGHDMALWRIESDARFAVAQDGLADAAEMSAVLVRRVGELSKYPAHEFVLILAHGPGDDDENLRWIAKIDQQADAVRALGQFRAVRVETLREDWPEKRAGSEERIREFVDMAARSNGRAIVIPYRVSGFGPFAQVLEGLTYEASGVGLLPSEEVRHWVRRQAEALRSQLAQAQ